MQLVSEPILFDPVATGHSLLICQGRASYFVCVLIDAGLIHSSLIV